MLAHSKSSITTLKLTDIEHKIDSFDAVNAPVSDVTNNCNALGHKCILAEKKCTVLDYAVGKLVETREVYFKYGNRIWGITVFDEEAPPVVYFPIYVNEIRCRYLKNFIWRVLEQYLSNHLIEKLTSSMNEVNFYT